MTNFEKIMIMFLIMMCKAELLPLPKTESRKTAFTRDPSASPWTPSPEMDLPEARTGHCFLSLGWDQEGDMRDLLVVAGGNKASGPLSTGAILNVVQRL